MIEIKNNELLNELVSICIASAKINKIKIIEENGTWEGTIPALHLYIYAERGSLKTTYLREIAKKCNQIIYKKVTTAMLSGSAEDSQSLISPAWVCRNSVMCLDEFNADNENAEEVKQALLDIMEFGTFSRVFARNIKVTNLTDKYNPYLYYRTEGGIVSYQTNVSVIIATMKEHRNSKIHSALISRCIPINYSIENVKDVCKGNCGLKIKEYKVKKEVTIKLKDWEYIFNFVCDNFPNDPGMQLRTAGMLCKIFAVKGKHDKDLYFNICALRSQYAVDKDGI